VHGLACQWSAEATTTGAWRLVGHSHVTQFVARGGSVKSGSVKNTTASRMRSGSGGRACLFTCEQPGCWPLRQHPCHASAAETTEPCRLVWVPSLLAEPCQLSWGRSPSSHHRDTTTDVYAACLYGSPKVKTSNLNTCPCGSFMVSSIPWTLVQGTVHTRTLKNKLPFPVHVAGVLDQNRPGRAFLRPTLSGDVPSLSLDDGKKRIGPPDHRTSLLEVATSSSSVRSAGADCG